MVDAVVDEAASVVTGVEEVADEAVDEEDSVVIEVEEAVDVGGSLIVEVAVEVEEVTGVDVDVEHPGVEQEREEFRNRKDQRSLLIK